MIRFLLLLIVFVLGLAGGAFWFGQMHHLRSAVPDRLPGWTQALPDEAGLRTGQIDWPASDVLQALELRWDFAGLSAEGLHWDVTLQGQGVDIRADFALFFWPDQGRLTGSAGQIGDKLGLGRLDLAGFEVEAEGLLTPDQMQAQGTIEIAGLRIEREDFGQGQMLAELQADGAWTGDMQLSGGVAPVEANLSGQRPVLAADLDLVIDEIDAIDARLLELLDQIGTRDGNQMRINARLPADLSGL